MTPTGGVGSGQGGLLPSLVVGKEVYYRAWWWARRFITVLGGGQGGLLPCLVVGKEVYYRPWWWARRFITVLGGGQGGLLPSLVVGKEVYWSRAAAGGVGIIVEGRGVIS